MRRKRLWLAVLFLLALVLALPLLLNLEMFRHQVHLALERHLGREVELASLTGRLLPRPGMVGRGVMVYDPESFGAEPFLYAQAVECDLPLRLLWTWRLEFSEIRFVRPSLNLVRNSERAWNVGMFLLPGSGNPTPSTGAGRPMPVISATDGRINIKLGVDKQVYALSDARLRLEPLADGRWHLELEATPIRVDRRLSETGEFRLRGEIGHGPEFSALPFHLETRLDGSSLAQLVTLFTGRQPPVRAQVSLAATLEGTPARWRTRGRLDISGLRRWDLVAASSTPRWQTDFDLTVVSPDRLLVVERAVVKSEATTVEFAGRVEDLFGRIRPDLRVTAATVALPELMQQFAGLKADVSPDARFTGAAQLALAARGPFADWQGELTAPQGISLRVPGVSAPVEAADLRLRLGRGRLELLPLTLKFAPAQALSIAGELQLLRPGLPYRLRWRSQAVELEPLQRTAAVFGWDLFGGGRWRGRAQMDLEWQPAPLGEAGVRWQGQVTLHGAKFHPPEFNDALDVEEARLEWRGPRVWIQPLRFRVGGEVVTGSLRREARTGPWNASFTAPRLELGAVDELFNPARRGLLERLVRREPSLAEPAWKRLTVIGEARIAELTAGAFRFSDVQAQGEWESGWLDLTRLRFRAYGGRFDGRLQGDFRDSPPQYRLAGNLRQAALRPLLSDTTGLGELFSGSVGADLTLQTAGTRRRDLLEHLQGHVVGGVADGAITHVNLLAEMSSAARVEPGPTGVGASTRLQSLSGNFRFADQRVELDGARLIVEGAALELSGRVGFDGRLDLTVTGEPLRLAGRPPIPLTAGLLSSVYRLTGTLERPEVQLAERAAEETPR